MKKAIKYIYDVNPFYVHWKKHFCPQCGERLELQYVSEIVNSNSPKAKDYDFSIGDTFLVGDVEFRTRCFHCKKCGANLSLQEVRKNEQRKGK